MSKISDLPEITNPLGEDIMVIEQDADGLNKKIQLDNLPIVADLASTANGFGASMVAIEDAAGNFTGAEVETALAELYAMMDGIDAWVSATTYTANEDVVIYTDNKIYRCVVTNSDAVFTPANWQTISDTSTPAKEIFTLSAADISNGYKDLTYRADDDSMTVTPIGGPEQEEGVDYTLSVVSMVTRVTFAGDLSSELAENDKLQVKYLYQ